MPEPRKRSRTLRRVYIRTPGGRNIIHYRPRKPKLGTCPITGETLKGVPRANSCKMQNMPKSSKRPSRPFGGVLSSRAMRMALKQRVRIQ
ncbi:50S ribosomal protein L34e [Candidatus Woesearchaeota archaeon]|nr:50S ribosomal protein L34e [Candidatus Woesearchaeota archaeon]